MAWRRIHFVPEQHDEKILPDGESDGKTEGYELRVTFGETNILEIVKKTKIRHFHGLEMHKKKKSRIPLLRNPIEQKIVCECRESSAINELMKYVRRRRGCDIGRFHWR